MKKHITWIILLIGSASYAYRDLETGTFLTRDHIGYQDGPNLYCYVHCNPITQFDALGLYADSTTEEDKDGNKHTEFEFSASVVFEDENLNEKDNNGNYVQQERRDEIMNTLKDSLIEGFTGKQGDHSWSLKDSNLDLSIASSAKDVPKNNHTIVITSDTTKVAANTPGRAEQGGGMAWIYTPSITAGDTTPAHEVMHLFGLNDNVGLWDNNLSESGMSGERQNPELSSKMTQQIQASVDASGLNKNIGPRNSTAIPHYRYSSELRNSAIEWSPRIINGQKYEENNYIH